ncbi:MAG: propanediol utilization protein [Clostridiales bacterium]|nr:MAG: propanediol utilization protein [Clostridiales bacterium]
MNKILIETSARHVHLTQEHIEILFGKGYQLTVKKDLSQPGQFACNERVTLKGPKSEIKNVSILGPARPDSQVEVSATDARSLGLSLPVRESGDIAGTPGLILIGPEGEVELSQGAIVAKRHIHLTPEAASEFGVSDKQIVNVRVVNNCRSIIFGDVVIRVSPKFAPAMHIDTDEANAGFIAPNTEGEIIL